MNDSLYSRCQKCKSALKLIAATEIPRCYFKFLNEAAEIELHTFVDAGEDAYAATFESYIKAIVL